MPVDLDLDLDDDLLIMLTDAARYLRTYGDKLAWAHGMTRAQLIILCRLQLQPQITQAELAALADVTPMTIARMIDRLEELDLVERCPDPADRRIWRLRLTPAAAPLLSELDRCRARLHAVATKGIKPAVLKAMALGLRQVKENLSSELADANCQIAAPSTIERVAPARPSRHHSA
jgi:MarR family transcriptional regulator, transcriptional regulator for hemolysin